ncbi:MAG: hypothetical protein HKL96_11055 [Phycisphaerales bacterium]|nr:hypothetical protein [Phycisphaerales bacterium]
MRRLPFYLAILVALFGVSLAGSGRAAAAASMIQVTIHPQQIRNTIAKGIYSQFLEHIYHSGDNGIWGEMIWNRSFEEPFRQRYTRFWAYYGPGPVTRSAHDPRNSQISMKISSARGETGVEQSDICLATAGNYRGSLWVRDTAPHKVYIRLMHGRTVLGMQSASVSSKAWRRIAFAFRTATAVHHATLQIGFTGDGVAYLDQVSMMSAAARKLGGFRPDTLKALQALKPALIRWPGGGYADSYHWMNGIGPQADRVSEHEIWDDMDPNALGTDEYIHLCHLTGAAPEICINIGPPTADNALRQQYVREACHWLAYCNAPITNKWGALRAKYGHPKPYNVKYWEIGNEVWWGRNGLTVPKYVHVLTQFVPALKRIDPSIHIIACGTGGLDQTWNRQLIKLAAGSFDYLSLHHYVAPQDFLTGVTKFLVFLRQTGQLIKASANPHCKIFVSEWNAQSIDWRTGLFAGGILIGFERQGAMVRLSTPALLLRWVRERDWNNALINFNHCSWFPAPNYVVEKLWRDHFAKYRLAATPAKPLEADATLSADRQTAFYKAVNPTSQTITLQLRMGSAFALATASAESVIASSLLEQNSMRHPHRIAPHRINASVSGQTLDLTLAPYSATVVTMKRK